MLGSDAGGAAGHGADPLYGQPTPDSVAGIGPGGSAPGAGFNQSSNTSGGSSGPAVYIEHYHDEGNSGSAGQDIGRHVEASYAAQSTPGAR